MKIEYGKSKTAEKTKRRQTNIRHLRTRSSNIHPNKEHRQPLNQHNQSAQESSWTQGCQIGQIQIVQNQQIETASKGKLRHSMQNWSQYSASLVHSTLMGQSSGREEGDDSNSKGNNSKVMNLPPLHKVKKDQVSSINNSFVGQYSRRSRGGNNSIYSSHSFNTNKAHASEGMPGYLSMNSSEERQSECKLLKQISANSNSQQEDSTRQSNTTKSKTSGQVPQIIEPVTMRNNNFTQQIHTPLQTKKMPEMSSLATSIKRKAAEKQNKLSLNEKLNNNFYKSVKHSNSIQNLAMTQNNFNNALLQSNSFQNLKLKVKKDATIKKIIVRKQEIKKLNLDQLKVLDKSSDFDRDETSYNNDETQRAKVINPRVNFTASPYRLDKNLMDKNSKSDELLQQNNNKHEKAEKLQSYLKNQTIKIKKIHRKTKGENSKLEGSASKTLKFIQYDPNFIKNIDTSKQGQENADIVQDLINHLKQVNTENDPLVQCIEKLVTNNLPKSPEWGNKSKSNPSDGSSQMVPKSKHKFRPKACFQDEFMQHYDQFSQSWREQINRQHGHPNRQPNRDGSQPKNQSYPVRYASYDQFKSQAGRTNGTQKKQ